MAQDMSAMSHTARAAAAKLSFPRRPTRFLAGIIGFFLLLALYHTGFEAWWPSASSNFAQRGHHIPPKIWQ